MTAPLKILFAGTPDFAAIHLSALLEAGHQVIGVYTQPDRPAGRGKKLMPSAVKQVALANELPVYQPANLKTEESQAQLSALEADLMIVVAYGLILPPQALNAPRLGCWNVHGSLLPKWRGAAPIQRAIWAGDEETGVTIMQMDEGLDTGDMLYKQAVKIDARETSASLYTKLAEVGPQALLHCLKHSAHLVPERQQDNDASYAKKLSKPEARLDWQSSAVQLERNIRAFNPWPVSYFEHEGQNIKVWQASVLPAKDAGAVSGEIVSADKHGLKVQTNDGVLCIERVQLPGKKPLAFADILNGRGDWFTPGQRLR